MRALAGSVGTSNAAEEACARKREATRKEPIWQSARRNSSPSAKMLTLIARAAGAVPLLPEDAGFKTLEPVVNSCACCEGSLAAMLDYCRAQKPMGDLHMEHFSCDNIHSPGCGASEAKCDCEARMAQLRQDNCTLKCKVLESVPFACPSAPCRRRRRRRRRRRWRSSPSAGRSPRRAARRCSASCRSSASRSSRRAAGRARRSATTRRTGTAGRWSPRRLRPAARRLVPRRVRQGAVRADGGPLARPLLAQAPRHVRRHPRRELRRLLREAVPRALHAGGADARRDRDAAALARGAVARQDGGDDDAGGGGRGAPRPVVSRRRPHSTLPPISHVPTQTPSLPHLPTPPPHSRLC